MLPRSARTLGLGTFVLLCSAPALAQIPPASTGRPFGSDSTPPPGAQAAGQVVVMRLGYTGAEGCPGEQAFRDAVGAHVRGWDPFGANAPWRLIVTIGRRPTGYDGAAELRDITGTVAWTRAFPATPRCVDLLEDLAVALVLHIDPPQGPPRSAASPPPVIPPPFDPAPEPGPKPPPPERPLIGLRFGAAMWMDLATAPRPAFAVTVDAGYRVSWFSIAAELRGDPPAGATMMGGAGLSTTRIAGALVPCGHVGERAAFVGCVLGEVGQVQGTVSAANLQAPDHQAGLSAAVGARVGVEIPLARHLSVRGAVDLMGAVVRPRFRLDQAVLWESPGFFGGLGVGLVAPF